MTGVTEPQLSPGGEWWWTGDAWVAAADHPDGRAALAALTAPAAPAPAPVPAPVQAAVQAPAPAPAPEPAFAAVAPEPSFAAVAAPAPAAAPAAATAPEPFYAAPPAPAAYSEPAAAAFRPPTANPAWAPPVAQPVAFAPAGTAPFDTLGLVSILCNLFPFFAIGQVAAVLVANKADRERAKLGYPGSGLAAVGRALGWIFGVLIGLGILLAIVLPVFVSRHHTAGPGSTRPIASQSINDTAIANVRAAASVEETYHQQFGIYTGNAGLAAHGYTPTGGVTLAVLHADRTRYCMKVDLGNAEGWFDSRTGNLTPTASCR